MTLEEKEDGEVDRRTAVAMFAGSGMVKKEQGQRSFGILGYSLFVSLKPIQWLMTKL